MSTHFDISEWLDFLRGFRHEADRSEMQQHLASNCKECNATVVMLRKVVLAVSADAAGKVPESVVRSARTIFALQAPAKVKILPRLLASLVYDSSCEPALAGVRSQQRMARHATYEAGNYCLDLRMEHKKGAPGVALVGHIANRARPDHHMAQVPVVLMSGKEVLGRALSNGFGDFQMEYKPKKSLRMYIAVLEARQRIQVELNELFNGQS